LNVEVQSSTGSGGLGALLASPSGTGLRATRFACNSFASDNAGAAIMSTDVMPREVYEALRDLAVDGPEAQVSQAMIEILRDQGYVEMMDGQPTVTEGGHVVLRDREHEFSALGKAD
jgi:hypothetical protein